MNWWEAVIYGVIQGLSEFLPVSSSGHLALLPHVMHIEDPGVVFDLMMHLGTALAVITYFKNDIIRYVKVFTPSLMDIKKGNADQWFVRNFIVSTFFSVLLIVLLLPVSKMARDPWFIIVNLSLFGGLLWISDIYSRKNPDPLNAPMESGMKWKLAITIGLAQALAIFPGVSRSGITLSAALFLGMRRKDAASFSFLMSLPIIFAGILKEVPDIMKEESQSKILVLFIGVASSFIVGWLTIHFFMKLIGKIQLGYFAFYRWIIAGLVWMSLS